MSPLKCGRVLSVSAAVVAGAAVLLLEANPNLTPNMVKMILMYTAQPLAGFNTFEQGAGQLNVAGAVAVAKLVRSELLGLTTPSAGSALLTQAAPSAQTTISSYAFPWAQGLVIKAANTSWPLSFSAWPSDRPNVQLLTNRWYIQSITVEPTYRLLSNYLGNNRLMTKFAFRAFALPHIFSLAVAVLFSGLATSTAFAQAGSDVVMVLPFENTSNRPEYNWVGESFADSLAELLNKPGLLVVSSDDRELAYQRLRLPETVIPSRATAIKLAREAKASLIVIGTYSVTAPEVDSKPYNAKPEKDKSSAEAYVQLTARVIKVNEGRTLGEMFDGSWATRQFDFGGLLTTLQNIQGRLAYQILYQRDKALPFSQNQLVQEATKVPQRAFEAYVKGVQLGERDSKRANYLKNALHFFADANGGAVYPQAAFELGRFYMLEGKWKEATEYFTKLQKKDPHYAEAGFYAGLGYAKLGDFGHALAALVPLSSDVPLIGIYNNAGAVAVQASREEKKEDERARLLAQGTSFLARAAESSPDDPMVHFNYALALFLSGKYSEAADQLKPVITADARDGQAYFLYAKSLEKIGKTETANAADDQARRYLQTYAKSQTEWQKSQTVNGVSLRMRDVLNRDDVSELMRKNAIAANTNPGSGTEDLLAKARDLYQAGRDDEALPELHRVVMLEPTNAEAYLLSGRINQRRGDQEAAIAALKTAIFWDPKLIDAHILLGRIFLERGDRGEATKYASSAMTIDSNNQEAIALQRQVTMGKN